jgi:hypothetical protein
MTYLWILAYESHSRVYLELNFDSEFKWAVS